MKLNAAQMLDPVFEFLDRLIRDYGDIMYMVFAYVAIAVIVWILGGGLRRKSNGKPVHDAPTVIFIYLPGSPPPPPETFDPFPPPREPSCPDYDDRHWD
jgi:hypothetical protein